MRLIDSPRFKTEYSQFQEKISKILNKEIQKELSQLLKQLLLEIKTLDLKHSEIIIAKNNFGLNETKDRILELRKKIQNKILECEGSGLLK